MFTNKFYQNLFLKQCLQYHLEVLTPLPCHCRVTLSRLSLGIPAVGRFSAEGNLRLGSKVAAEKPTEVNPG